MSSTTTGLKGAPAGPGLAIRHRLPAYWRGRARGLLFLAAQERQNGNWEAADELDRLATLYEANAEALEYKARPSGHRL